MKYTLFLFIVLMQMSANAQHERLNPHAINFSESLNTKSDEQKSLSNDPNIDVNFYHLDLKIAIDSEYIEGNVSYVFTSLIDGLNSVVLDLDDSFIIDSIPASDSYTFLNKELTIDLLTSYNLGETFSFAVYYHGAPPLAGGYKGLRYELHNGNEPIIASLSTPYLAHTWWPCKDGLHDKADSTFIDITIKDAVINSLPLIVVSNGLLDTVETIGAFKTFKWKHYYPIVPYYVMVAISNFEHFQQTYTGPGYSFPMDYYVFNTHLFNAQNGVADLPNVMEFFTNTFGPYPFLEEKYAMTQLGYYGGIENQTNSIVNNMGLSWFNVTVHELAHQWFADMITCETWNHGWLNEGITSYAEALYDEHVNGFSSYQNYMQDFEFYDPGTIYLSDVSDPFSVFHPIIYDKGAYVMHMLRGVVGDPIFFDGLYNYSTSTSHQYKHASTDDLQQVFENASGQNLDYFFAQWIYDQSYPTYRYNFDQNLTSGDFDLSIVQSQSDVGWRDVFIMPMEINIEFTDFTDTTVNVFNDLEFQTFSFNFSKEVNNVTLDPNKWILKNTYFDQNVNVGISELSEGDFSIFPNPSSGIFNIQSESNKNFKVIVMDLNGKEKREINLYSSKNGSHSVDLSELSSGIYFVKIVSSKGSLVKRVSVK